MSSRSPTVGPYTTLDCPGVDGIAQRRRRCVTQSPAVNIGARRGPCGHMEVLKEKVAKEKLKKLKVSMSMIKIAHHARCHDIL